MRETTDDGGMAGSPAHRAARPVSGGAGSSTTLAVDREAFERTRVAHEATPVATAIWSPGGMLLHANAVQCDLWGDELVDLVGIDILTHVDPVGHDEVTSGLHDLCELHRTSLWCELRCFDPTGAPVWLRAVVLSSLGGVTEADRFVPCRGIPRIPHAD